MEIKFKVDSRTYINKHQLTFHLDKMALELDTVIQNMHEDARHIQGFIQKGKYDGHDVKFVKGPLVDSVHNWSLLGYAHQCLQELAHHLEELGDIHQHMTETMEIIKSISQDTQIKTSTEEEKNEKHTAQDRADSKNIQAEG